MRGLRAGFFERTWFWLKEMATFPPWIIIWIIAIGCGVFLSRRQKRSDEKIEISEPQRFLVYLFAGALVYYPLIHTLMGAPLYRRMLFPLLPLAALLIAWLIIEAVRICSAYCTRSSSRNRSKKERLMTSPFSKP